MDEQKLYVHAVLGVLPQYCQMGDLELRGLGWRHGISGDRWAWDREEVHSYPLDALKLLYAQLVSGPMDYTPDAIDWSQVDERWNYCARDSNGDVYLYPRRPAIDRVRRCFGDFDGERWTLSASRAEASYRRGSCEWYDSLIVRPKE